MPRDGVAQGLEVEAVLAAEAAWEQWDAAALMAGCFNMDLDSPQHLPEGGDGSISAPNSSALNKDNLDGEEQSLQAPAAMSLEESNRRINRHHCRLKSKSERGQLQRLMLQILCI